MKLAFICGGRTYKKDSTEKNQLQFIDHSVEKVTEVLNSHRWKCESIEHLQSTKEYMDVLANYKNETIDEFLFYFTGHGYGNKNSTFEIYLEENELTIEQLKKATISTFQRQPRKIALVIDSCYSGMAVDKNYKNIEILSSTNDRTESFEKEGLYEDDFNYGISVFSYYFCEAFNIPNESDVITLKSIATHIEESQTKQKPYCSEALERERVTLGYSQEINQIYQILKEKFPIPKAFKKAILTYLKNDSLNFDKIQPLEYNQKLFQKLLEEKECLYCLLKVLNLHEKYSHRVKKVENCKAYREEIAKKREIKSIILVVQNSTDNKINDCTINCHQEKSDGVYNLNFAYLFNIDFSKDGNYQEEIGKILSTVPTTNDVLELKLILPEELFKVDFYTIKVKTKFSEKNILEVFNISKKILMRFTHYRENGYFERWEKNQKNFNNLKSASMEEHTFLIDKKEKIPYFGKTLTQGEVIDKEKIEYLAVHSHYALVEINHIMNMVEWGVPIVLSAKEDEVFEVSWQECCVEDMKLVVSNHINYNQNRLFIHDNYDEVVTLQEAIEKEKKRS